MPLDPKKYPVADEPWPYATVAANLAHWNYVPVGDHTPQYLLNEAGFLRWEREDPATGSKKSFIISTPKWRTWGMDEPVWPAKVITTAMFTQEVFQRAGSSDEPPSSSVVPLFLK